VNRRSRRRDARIVRRRGRRPPRFRARPGRDAIGPV